MGRVWKFKEILGHKRVQPSDPDYMGSMPQRRGNGEVREPLHTKTRPACTTDDRCHLRARSPLPQNSTSRAIRATRNTQRVRRSIHGDSGSRLQQAVSIDEDNKNTKWQDSPKKNSVRLMNDLQ
jgi:hypothetical protein